MKYFVTEKFRETFRELPPRIQRRARAAYRLWKRNPYHPSLQFKRIHEVKPIYSTHVDDRRALGVHNANEFVWFWIGSHEEYNNLIARL